MSEQVQCNLPEFTVGRGGVKLPSLYDESWDPDVPEFFSLLWKLNDSQRLGVVAGKELLMPPDADEPLVCIRYSYQERPAADVQAERDRQLYVRHAVTVGTGRHEILQAGTGIAWDPYLTYTYNSQAGGSTTPGPHYEMQWRGQGVAAHDLRDATPFKPNETANAYWERIDLLYREQIRSVLEETVRLLSPAS